MYIDGSKLFFGIDGKSSGFFRSVSLLIWLLFYCRNFRNVFVFTHREVWCADSWDLMSKRAGNKLEKLLGGFSRSPVSELWNLPAGGSQKTCWEERFCWNLCDIIPRGETCRWEHFLCVFFSGPHSWAAWSWGVTPKTKVGGFGTHHQAGESWAFESYGQSCDQGTERILFFWIESVTRGRVQGMGIIFEAWAAQMVSWRWIKIWWTKFSAPKSCWLKKWIPGGRWNIFDPTWSTRVPRPWGGPVWIFFVLLKLGNVDTMLEAVVFVVCWQFFG